MVRETSWEATTALPVQVNTAATGLNVLDQRYNALLLSTLGAEVFNGIPFGISVLPPAYDRLTKQLSLTRWARLPVAKTDISEPFVVDSRLRHAIPPL